MYSAYVCSRVIRVNLKGTLSITEGFMRVIQIMLSFCSEWKHSVHPSQCLLWLMSLFPLHPMYPAVSVAAVVVATEAAKVQRWCWCWCCGWFSRYFTLLRSWFSWLLLVLVVVVVVVGGGGGGGGGHKGSLLWRKPLSICLACQVERSFRANSNDLPGGDGQLFALQSWQFPEHGRRFKRGNIVCFASKAAPAASLE